MKIAKKITELIGNTPMLEFNNFTSSENLQTGIIGKLEYFNPLGSAKDRVGYAMLKDAEEKGLLTADTVIIEPTSGNTGIGLAFTAASCGYKLILTMPETMSQERIKLLKALGAEIVLTPGKTGMKGAIDKANELAHEYPKAFIPQQFTNKANPAAHKASTGKEIWRDTAGKIDIFVATVGTGGTITGVGEYLKSQNPQIQIVAVEPYNSAVLSGEEPGPHNLQGIGAGFIPEVLNVGIIDEIIKVRDEEAYSTCRKLAKKEGLLVGISSGAAVFAASVLAKKAENKDKMIVALLPDTGERYLSTELFS